MVVILIIAILAALVVPRIVGRTGQAKVAKAQQDIATMSGLLDQFRLDNDRYPTTEEGLSALRVPPADAKNKEPYTTRDIPNDPWGNPYEYTYPGTSGPNSFSIVSYGADGQPGGDGDAADITGGD
jgi:general secretion pathway protein G